uniref:Leucine-rich repeat protein n=1 Tax=viral metagenome TaxID=1070528 RepID=A0A6C0KT81_9ZZZZ
MTDSPEGPEGPYPYAFHADYDDTIDDFKVLHLFYVTPDDIKNYTFPDEIDNLYISGDYLDEFIIPNGVKSAYIKNLGIRKLYVPDSIKFLYCSNNHLRYLELPNTIEDLDASNNYLTTITFRNKELPVELECLSIEKNRIIDLSFEALKLNNLVIDKKFPLPNMSNSIKNIFLQTD